MVRTPLFFRITDLILAIAGFAATVCIWVVLFPDLPVSLDRPSLIFNSALFCFVYWVVLEVISSREADKGWIPLFIEQASVSVGVSFILLALLTYLAAGDYNPLLISLCSLSSTILLVSAEVLIYRRFLGTDNGILLLGASKAAERLTASLQQPVLGVLDLDGKEGGGIPYLGDFGRIDEVVRGSKPRLIVVSDRKLVDRHIPADLLVRYRLQGVTVQDIVQLGETLARRITCEQLDPTDILLYPPLRASRAAMAIQAIYTNLIGLALLTLFTPVLVLVGLASLFMSDRGPLFEKIECCGFQKTPFRLLRFRTRKMSGGGQLTAIGAVLTKLRIVNLPQLINIVRGELALCGPRPVRMEFAHSIVKRIPYYSHRFTVKPGVAGLDTVYLGSRPEHPVSEYALLTYDLYYVKHGRALLDLDILLSMILRAKR